MNKTVIFDLDGVVFDFISGMSKVIGVEIGLTHSYNDLTGVVKEDVEEFIDKCFRHKDFFKSLQLIDETFIDLYRLLKKSGIRVIYLSAAGMAKKFCREVHSHRRLNLAMYGIEDELILTDSAKDKYEILSRFSKDMEIAVFEDHPNTLAWCHNNSVNAFAPATIPYCIALSPLFDRRNLPLSAPGPFPSIHFYRSFDSVIEPLFESLKLT